MEETAKGVVNYWFHLNQEKQHLLSSHNSNRSSKETNPNDILVCLRNYATPSYWEYNMSSRKNHIRYICFARHLFDICSRAIIL